MRFEPNCLAAEPVPMCRAVYNNHRPLAEHPMDVDVDVETVRPETDSRQSVYVIK